MALSLHTTKSYEVVYGQNAINGWDSVSKFLGYLRKLQREGKADDVYINEEETEVEIPFGLLRKLNRNSRKWRKVAQIILRESDKRHDYAHLEIW